jgi:NAD kinase
MKRSITIFTYLLIFLSANFLLIQSCKAKKEASLTEHMLSVEIIDKLTEEYLTENYSEILSAKRSNKTLNKYLCKIKVSKDGYEKLIATLEQDANVLNINKVSDQPGKPSMSTNTGKAKSKPIKQ